MSAVLTPAADEDLLAIWLHIAEQNLPAANRQLEVFNERFELLDSMPELGTLCPEIAVGLRNFSIGSYVVYYRREEEITVIMRILHGARDVRKIFSG